MRILISLTRIATLLILAVATISGTFSNSATIHAQTVNKPSIQITLRTHQQYYRNGQEDQETWSWTPRILYRVVGPISAGKQMSLEFNLPSGKPRMKLDRST